MLGLGALGQLALGQGPSSSSPPPPATQTLVFGSSFGAPLATKLAIAVIASTFGGFVAPPQSAQAAVFSQFSQPFAPRINLPDEQPSALFEVAPPPVISIVFTQFSQPQFNRAVIPDEQPSTLFEILPPVAPPFTGFATFEGIIRARFNVALYSDIRFVPAPIIPADTHDGVWVKRKKRSGRDPIDLELEEKASRRAALELAVYGPAKQIIAPKPVKTPVINSPVDVVDLAKIVLLARQAHDESIKAQASSDDEDDLESILREIL